jgi:putative ABC transport system ATP-binding protein
MCNAIIKIENISKIYTNGKHTIHALDNISLEIKHGEFIAIIGQSGSGKSTLMNTIGCLDLPDNGKYYLDGKNISNIPERELSSIRNKKIGFIFQGFNLIPGMNATENVELPLFYRGVDKKIRRKKAEEALEKVGLKSRMHHNPNQMSGGQQQRVAIARAICAKPAIILADEPTGNLDTGSGDEIMGILRDINSEGRTVILITHDTDIARSADRVIRISDGRIQGLTFS